MTVDVKALVSRYDALKSERAIWEATWQKVADYVSPVPRNFYGEQRGPKKNVVVIDTTATESCIQLAHALNGSLTNPATDWFHASVNDASLSQDNEVVQWLDQVRRITNHYLQQSNFGEAMIEAYQDFLMYGTVGMLIEPDEKDLVCFSARNINELVISEGVNGRIDTIFRKSNMTARQAGQKFTVEKLTDAQKKTLDNTPDKKLNILHVIMPRKDVQKGKVDKKNKPIASIWIDLDTKTIMEEGGYDEPPMPVARWAKVAGEVYAYSPSIQCLNDIIALNKMEEEGLVGKQLASRPPIVFDDDSLLSEVKWLPGMRIIKRKNAAMPQALNMGQQPQAGDSAIADRREQIRRTYFADIIMNKELKYVTAEGIHQNADERERILTSVLGRLQSELLEPLVERTFAILYRARVFPPVPKQLEGKNWRPVWTSPLARKQLERKADGLTTMFGIGGQIAGMFAKPDGSNPFLERFNADKLSYELAEIFGNLNICYSDYEIQTSRQASRQAQAQQQQAQQAIDAAPKLAQAEQMTQGSNGPIGEMLKQLGSGSGGMMGGGNV